MKKLKFLLISLIATPFLVNCNHGDVTFTITWINDDDTVLEVDRDVKKGTIPTYDGAQPYKAFDDSCYYTFAGWDKEPYAATKSETYRATYRKVDISNIDVYARVIIPTSHLSIQIIYESLGSTEIDWGDNIKNSFSYHIYNEPGEYDIKIKGISYFSLSKGNEYVKEIYSSNSISNFSFSNCESLIYANIPNVNRLHESSFDGCTSLVSVKIPRTVENIDPDGFANCRSLASIVVDEQNETFDSRDNCNAIMTKKEAYIDFDIVPENTLVIGCNATVIPDSTVSIAYSAFNGRSISSVFIPKTINSIGYNPFCNCASLESIIVDEQNETFDSRNNCNAIITKKETVVGYHTFPENTLLVGCKSTVITNDVSLIGPGAFEGSSIASITITDNINKICDSAFKNCLSLTTVDISDNIDEIEPNIFCGCSILKTVNIPSNHNFKEIPANMFDGCSSLETITIPNTIETIDFGAFCNCSALKSIAIPANVSKLGDGVFEGCSSLETIIVDELNETFDSRNNCNAIITRKETQVGVYSAPKDALVVGCKKTVFDSTVTSIFDSAFQNNNGISSINIPSTVISISNTAFRGCSNLSSIVIDENNPYYYSSNANAIITKAEIGEISENTLLHGCKDTIIPSAVTSIYKYAFYNNELLTSITIPNSVTKIGDSAFMRCPLLSIIDLVGYDNPAFIPKLDGGFDYVFYDDNILTIKVASEEMANAFINDSTEGWPKDLSMYSW